MLTQASYRRLTQHTKKNKTKQHLDTRNVQNKMLIMETMKLCYSLLKKKKYSIYGSCKFLKEMAVEIMLNVINT